MEPPQIDEQHNLTNNALMAIQFALPELEREPLPEKVFHYTDSSGLLGILNSGVLWATHYRFLNDSSELKYIFDLEASSQGQSGWLRQPAQIHTL